MRIRFPFRRPSATLPASPAAHARMQALWAEMAAEVLDPIINGSSCWKEEYGHNESWSHAWAIIVQVSSGRKIELDPWKSGGSQYRP